MSILAVIGAGLTLLLGIWNFIARLKSEKRRVALESKDKLDEAIKDDDSSDFIDGFGSVNRMRNH